MLILTRNAGESIILGEGDSKITVQVLATHNGQVRLGITAPKEVPVHREEIYQKIHGEKITEEKKVVVSAIRRPKPKTDDTKAPANAAMQLAFAKAGHESKD